MTNTDYQAPESVKNMEKYRAGALASILANSEDSRHIQGALEQLASDVGIEDEAKGFIIGAMASEEGKISAVNYYASKYNKNLGETKIKDLFMLYSDDIKNYVGFDENATENPEYAKIADEFEKYKDKQYNEIKTALIEANDTIKKAKKEARKRNKTVTREQVEAANKTIEKYGLVSDIINSMEEYRISEINPKAVERTTKRLVRRYAGIDDYAEEE